MPCEMCGKEVPRLRKVVIGASELEVCNECARFGREVRPAAPRPEPEASGTAAVATAPKAIERVETRRPRDVLSRGTEELVEDYPRRISKARQRKGQTQEGLARDLNEKKSVISRLESGEIRPDEKLIRKLEKALDIKLKERVEYEVEPVKKGSPTGGVTLGDLIRMEK